MAPITKIFAHQDRVYTSETTLHNATGMRGETVASLAVSEPLPAVVCHVYSGELFADFDEAAAKVVRDGLRMIMFKLLPNRRTYEVVAVAETETYRRLSETTIAGH